MKLKDLFRKKSFDETFIRQPDDVSCAAASCATIARLYDLDPALNFRFFRKALKVDFDGAHDADIEKAARTYLPVEKAGRNTYRGGIALGAIIHKPDGDAHSVVFLARKDETLIYYDPHEHKIFSDHVRNMRRPLNDEGRTDTWTANCPAIPGADFDFWARLAEPNPYSLRRQVFWIREHRKP